MSSSAAPRAPEYADNAYDQIETAARRFPPGLTDPEWYPAGHSYPGMSEYYSNYWDRMPEVPSQYYMGSYGYSPQAFYDESLPADVSKPVVYNGQTYSYY